MCTNICPSTSPSPLLLHLQSSHLAEVRRHFVSTITVSKIKCTLVHTLRLCTGRTAHEGSRGIALPYHDHGTRRGREFSSTPQPIFTPGKDPVPIVYRRLGGPHGRSGQVQKSSPPQGFDPRTVQPVASCCINYATWPTR
jgi:hypothetical protein